MKIKLDEKTKIRVGIRDVYLTVRVTIKRLVT